MTDQLDRHAIIKRLAEAELRCQHPKVLAWDVQEAINDCPDCGGEGRTVPFASLRVECPGFSDSLGLWSSCLSTRSTWPCVTCGGNTWVPEPDVERACWRVWKTLTENINLDDLLTSGNTWEEAVLLAGEDLLDEMVKEETT